MGTIRDKFKGVFICVIKFGEFREDNTKGVFSYESSFGVLSADRIVFSSWRIESKPKRILSFLSLHF